MRGKLVKAMSGTRDVAQNLQRICSATVQELGAGTGRVSHGHCCHPECGFVGMCPSAATLYS